MMDQKMRMDDLEQLVQELSNKLSSLTESSRVLQSATISSGDTAWMLTSTALVLFMTMPGLAIYYSGMIREKNVLACAMQIFTIACLITFLWLAFGYSLSFSPINSTINPDTINAVYGSAERLWLDGMTLDTTNQLAPTIPEAVFCAYQLTFAIITAALICGSFADRMKYVPMMIFIIFWHLIVYCPIAHSNWHPDGWLFQLGVLDYAGGNVVHISSGVSGLVTVLVIGNRKGFGVDRFEPHNVVLTFMGMSMLWVGWYGFNAGSAYAANTRAAFALLATQIATSVSALMWMITEWRIRKQPSVLGMINGAIAGLVCITPAAGYVNMTGAFFIGFIGGPLCYGGIQLKHKLGYDDALDAFGVHAIGGIIGGILVGFFATDKVSGGSNGVFYAGMHVGGRQLAMQIVGILFSIGWSFVGTYLILKVLDMTIGLRVSPLHEDEGLDYSIHRERGFAKSVHLMDLQLPLSVTKGSMNNTNIALQIVAQKDEGKEGEKDEIIELETPKMQRTARMRNSDSGESGGSSECSA